MPHPPGKMAVITTKLGKLHAILNYWNEWMKVKKNLINFLPEGNHKLIEAERSRLSFLQEKRIQIVT